MASQPITYIVGISGPSSSGKTTLARLLHQIFSDLTTGQANKLHTFIIHEDDFYHPDNKIPYMTLPSGAKIQDWDTPTAINTTALSNSLTHVQKTGHLPPTQSSKEDQNTSGPPVVPESLIAELRSLVQTRLSSTSTSTASTPSSIAFLEGFLLFAPPVDQPGKWADSHPSRPIHEKIHLSLFLPAVYSAVKVRREGRDGYVTIGEQPAPGPGNLSSTESESGSLPVEKTGEGGDSLDGPAELNFWVDPPGYVDDVVWPRYLKYHDWLLVPVDRDAAERGDLVEAFGEGGSVILMLV
ncbi:hypothetical protein N7533_008128 [Penicillium manginii]|uniref:uncharacterized protein n=1 Tax=Penicillium manginii TaxID=203109 RepID=UPI002548250E|nr:uncharacterized protein N7533_008128 [Penicillium manginii]KAJ5751100.1 hypothetical protein N7533_008128 [Penicillium manginii]